jgi:hypothetical protein
MRKWCAPYELTAYKGVMTYNTQASGETPAPWLAERGW